MSTFIGLTGVIIVCIIAVWFFSPRYGAGRGCTGRALEAAMEHAREREKELEEKKKQGQERNEGQCVD